MKDSYFLTITANCPSQYWRQKPIWKIVSLLGGCFFDDIYVRDENGPGPSQVYRTNAPIILEYLVKHLRIKAK